MQQDYACGVFLRLNSRLIRKLIAIAVFLSDIVKEFSILAALGDYVVGKRVVGSKMRLQSLLINVFIS